MAPIKLKQHLGLGLPNASIAFCDGPVRALQSAFQAGSLSSLSNAEPSPLAPQEAHR